MQPTSSETFARPSNGSRIGPTLTWLGVAGAFIALAFAGTSSGTVDPNAFFKYSFAVSSAAAYAVLVAITLAIARWQGRTLASAGLTSFSWRWVGVAVGLIVLVLILGTVLEPVLHAGEKQGLEPDKWQPHHAAAFAVNGLVVATIVPFAEELFFRGLGVRVLLPFGGVAAVFVTAAAFGLAHGLFSALPVLAIFGAALGWVRLRSGSAWPGMVAHGFYNGVAILIVYFTLA